MTVALLRRLARELAETERATALNELWRVVPAPAAAVRVRSLEGDFADVVTVDLAPGHGLSVDELEAAFGPLTAPPIAPGGRARLRGEIRAASMPVAVALVFVAPEDREPVRQIVLQRGA